MSAYVAAVGHVIARLPDRAREALLLLESRRLQGIGAAFRRDRTTATLQATPRRSKCVR